MTIFGRIDHGAGAMQAGLALNPVEVLVFGNPRAGTPLMQASPFIGIDLPLRALVWEDDVGQTWITSIDPTWLVARYQLASANIQRVVQEMTGSQSDIVRSAASGG
jgi:uncharacterized protein (DUF302 family)